MVYEKLLSPVNIGSLTIKNRTMMTAAEMNMGQINGCPTERLMSYYEERAKGGVGLIIPGICRVNDGYARPVCLPAFNERCDYPQKARYNI